LVGGQMGRVQVSRGGKLKWWAAPAHPPSCLAPTPIPTHPTPPHQPLAGPPGRKADMVGCFLFIHRDDLKRLAPDWLTFTDAVRQDPDVSTAGPAVPGGPLCRPGGPRGTPLQAQRSQGPPSAGPAVPGGPLCRPGGPRGTSLQAQRSQGDPSAGPAVPGGPLCRPSGPRWTPLQARRSQGDPSVGPAVPGGPLCRPGACWVTRTQRARATRLGSLGACACRPGACRVTLTQRARATSLGSVRCMATSMLLPRRMCGTTLTMSACCTQAMSQKVGPAGSRQQGRGRVMHAVPRL
jgi:hypothetical protein